VGTCLCVTGVNPFTGRRANEAARGDHYHTVANPAKDEPAGGRGLPNRGYRPGRKTARRRSWP
jgi:hypothetical protein